MPTSPFGHINSLVGYLLRINPSSLLDIGLGNGKIGFIARDALDVMLGERYKKEEWKVRIDGIEIFPDYIQDHQKAIYDEIYIGNAFEVIDTLGRYDVIVLGDVLEHFDKRQAFQFLDKCVEHSNSNIIICIPLGKEWNQPEIYGNPQEKHLSVWNYEEFKPFSRSNDLFKTGDGKHYGIFLVNKEDYIDYKIRQLRSLEEAYIGNPNLNIRQRYSLTIENISHIDLSCFAKYVANFEHRNYFLDVDFREHYRLIAYLGTLFDNSNIFDIGTCLGYSALALSYNNTNRVISYDIFECKELAHAEELSSIEYLLGDVLNDERLLESPLIMLDTNHDGVFEKRFYEFLKGNRYKGLVLLDDIHLNEPMKKFWSSITETKEDVTDLGHWSGSGLVEFR
jgi:hypothetical protein